MILIDANLLLYAVNPDAPLHRKAKRWLEDTLSGGQTVAFSWSVILAFVRLTTRSGLFQHPLPLEVAFEVVAEWLAQPVATVVHPGPRHLAMLREEDVVAIRGEAQTRYYRLKDAHLRAIIHALCEICVHAA